MFPVLIKAANSSDKLIEGNIEHFSRAIRVLILSGLPACHMYSSGLFHDNNPAICDVKEEWGSLRQFILYNLQHIKGSVDYKCSSLAKNLKFVQDDLWSLV